MVLRALIVLLLVLNVGVAAWWLLRDDAAQAPTSVATDSSAVPRLQLVNEAHRAAPPAATAATVVPVETTTSEQETPPVEEEAPPAVASQCFRIGPFQTAAAATSARDALGARIVANQLRREEAPGPGNWDVAIPPQADRAAAQALATRIQAAGFSDYYVIASGEGANGIALGRFGTQEAAQRHLAALQAAGLPAQLRPPAPVERHWLDVQAAPDIGADALAGVVAAARVQPRDCVAGG